jgi:hypothetical protein
LESGVFVEECGLDHLLLEVSFPSQHHHLSRVINYHGLNEDCSLGFVFLLGFKAWESQFLPFCHFPDGLQGKVLVFPEHFTQAL